MRALAVSLSLVFLASCGGCSGGPPPPPTPPSPVPPPPPPAVTPPAIPPQPAAGTRTTVAEKANDDTWDQMLVAGGRVWVITDVSRWTTGPMYVPTARLWSVPVTGGELAHHLELEGTAKIDADDASVYVAVNKNLAKGAPRSGRILRVPFAGGAAVDVVTGVEPHSLGVDGDTVWFDDQRAPKAGSKSPVPSGIKGPLAFAFDAQNVYFTTAKGGGPPGDTTGARIFRMPKGGGKPTMLAAKLPDEATGLAVDETHAYFCAVSWSSEAAEKAGIVGRVPKEGGAVEILAKDQAAVRKLWIAEGSVFFLSGRGGRPASIRRVAKAGGEVTIVASDATLEFSTIDASAAYFSSDGLFDPNTHARLAPGSIVRIAR